MPSPYKYITGECARITCICAGSRVTGLKRPRIFRTLVAPCAFVDDLARLPRLCPYIRSTRRRPSGGGAGHLRTSGGLAVNEAMTSLRQPLQRTRTRFFVLLPHVDRVAYTCMHSPCMCGCGGLRMHEIHRLTTLPGLFQAHTRHSYLSIQHRKCRFARRYSATKGVRVYPTRRTPLYETHPPRVSWASLKRRQFFPT